MPELMNDALSALAFFPDYVYSFLLPSSDLEIGAAKSKKLKLLTVSTYFSDLVLGACAGCDAFFLALVSS